MEEEFFDDKDIDDLADKLLEEEAKYNTSKKTTTVVEYGDKQNAVEAKADELVEKENKHDRQAKFNKEFQEILASLAKNGAKLRAVQLEIQKKLSKYFGREIQVPYEITDAMIEDPQSIGNLDALEEMTKYYNESFESTLEASKTAKKFGERHFNKKISPLYLKAYDLASAMFSDTNAFYKKYKDLLEVETPEPVKPEPAEPKQLENTTPAELPLKKDEPAKPEPKKEPVPKKSSTKTPAPVEEDRPSLLKQIDEKYYKPIFALLNTTAVIGSKYKYNTLDYLEYEVKNADISKMQELGFPVNDPEKCELIKQVCLKFIKESKAIRRDQWLPITSEKKQGEFDGRRHTAQAAIINRNTRLMKMYGIDLELAKKYGIAVSVKELNKNEGVKKEEKTLVSSVKDDPKFVEFYENFKTVYKLGSPTSESNNFLYTIHRDLKKEENSFGLTGESLKAAKILVEKTIVARRNTWKRGNEASKNSIEELQKDLGL